jgi:hypothetical protein
MRLDRVFYGQDKANRLNKEAMWQVKKEILFEKSVPSHRWNPDRFAQEALKLKKREWKIKPAKLAG